MKSVKSLLHMQEDLHPVPSYLVKHSVVICTCNSHAGERGTTIQPQVPVRGPVSTTHEGWRARLLSGLQKHTHTPTHVSSFIVVFCMRNGSGRALSKSHCVQTTRSTVLFVPSVSKFLAIEDRVEQFSDHELSRLLLFCFFLASIK